MGARRQAAGFTLVELLVVVAILAILSAIAAFNLLEAQTRARISRAKSDLRVIASAVESYRVDMGRYPIPLNVFHDALSASDALSLVHELSTPVAYLATVALPDPFTQPDVPPTYWYASYTGAFLMQNPNLRRFKFDGFCVASVGPDHEWNAVVLLPPFIGTPNEGGFLERLYDPTNGTISDGDIARWTVKRPIGG